MSDNKDEILDNAIKELVDIAFKDGVVDDAEWNLIHEMEIGLDTFLRVLDKAEEDNVITDDEKNMLISLEKKIIDNVERVADEDGFRDDEEKALIAKLSTILAKYTD